MLLVLLLVAQVQVNAQVADAGGRVSGMAGTGAALPAQHWTTINPAAIGRATERRVAFQASQGFGMPELRQGGMAVVWPIRFASIAAEALTFGFDAFRTTTSRLSVAGRLTEIGGLIGGVSIAAHTVSIDGFGSASAVTLNLGWMMMPRPGFSIGGSIYNLHGGRWAPDEELRQVMRIGVAYSTPFATLAFDLEKDQRADASARGGVEFPLVPALHLRSGAATSPTRVAMGAGVRTGRLEFDFAAERHQDLGWTPAMSMSLSF